jgi:hypothetical protein
MRFTIRDLVWLTILVAVALGWFVHARQANAQKRQLQTDLLMQADFVDQFISVLTNLGCEIPPDSDPRCAAGGPYTRIFVPEKVQAVTHCVSFTLSGPRSELQRNIDGEFDQLRPLLSR